MTTKTNENLVDLAPGETAALIEENAMLRSALQKATAAFLYANGVRDEVLPGWDSLPDESYAVEGGIRSGRATYLAQAADVDDWMKYWEVA